VVEEPGTAHRRSGRCRDFQFGHLGPGHPVEVLKVEKENSDASRARLPEPSEDHDLGECNEALRGGTSPRVGTPLGDAGPLHEPWQQSSPDGEDLYLVDA
jgi:hypothetical protein